MSEESPTWGGKRLGGMRERVEWGESYLGKEKTWRGEVGY